MREEDRRGPRSRRVAARPATDDEREGRPLVRRACVAAVVGGALIALVAATFGPRFFVADVRAVGIGAGVLAAALGLAPVLGARAAPLSGPLLIAVGVVALPVAAGGLVAGSALVLAAGVVLVALRPAPPGAPVVRERGHLPRRAAAAAVDTALAAVLVVAVATQVAALREAPVLVYALWAGAWLLVTLPAALLCGASPGAWLLGVALRGPDGGAAHPLAVAARQLVRGALAVGTVLLTASAGLAAGPAAAVAALAAGGLVAAVLVVDRGTTSWLDAATRARPLTELVRAC